MIVILDQNEIRGENYRNLLLNTVQLLSTENIILLFFVRSTNAPVSLLSLRALKLHVLIVLINMLSYHAQFLITWRHSISSPFLVVHRKHSSKLFITLVIRLCTKLREHFPEAPHPSPTRSDPILYRSLGRHHLVSKYQTKPTDLEPYHKPRQIESGHRQCKQFAFLSRIGLYF